jgi:hypothetical protein
VLRYAREFPATSDGTPDFNSQLASTLLQYIESSAARSANRVRSGSALLGSTSSATGRELRYWDLARRLAVDDARGAVSGAEETLASPATSISCEFEWRIAAVGAAAARRLNDADRERMFRDRAEQALRRLRAEWKDAAPSYIARPDLVELRRKAGLN